MKRLFRLFVLIFTSVVIGLIVLKISDNYLLWILSVVITVLCGGMLYNLIHKRKKG